MYRTIKWMIITEFRMDWRSRYPFAGLLLYAITLVVVSYYAFSGFIEVTVWNALFWLILLFVSINAVAKSFVQQNNRTTYLFFLVKPEILILSKLIYYSIYQLLLVLVALVVFFVLFGMPVSGPFGFYLNLLLGSTGLSVTFSMISAIASRTGNNAVMMAVLGFPVVIPIMVLAVTNSEVLVLGGAIGDISTHMITLLSMNVIIIALAYVLFPFTWKS